MKRMVVEKEEKKLASRAITGGKGKASGLKIFYHYFNHVPIWHTISSCQIVKDNADRLLSRGKNLDNFKFLILSLYFFF